MAERTLVRRRRGEGGGSRRRGEDFGEKKGRGVGDLVSRGKALGG